MDENKLNEIRIQALEKDIHMFAKIIHDMNNRLNKLEDKIQ